MSRPGADRRPQTRGRDRGHRQPHLRPCRRPDPGPAVQCPRGHDRQPRGGRVGGALADSPRPARVPRAGDRGRDARDGREGDGPCRAVHQGRQGGRVRRCGHRQDGHHPGADPQHRRRAPGRLRVRRSRRALPRGQRPVARDAGFGRSGQHRARIRPDERAAGDKGPRRHDRRDDGRVLQRDSEPGRSPVHRQHLPLHPGGDGGIGAAWQNAVRGGLPADAGHRDGRPGGADHVRRSGFDHLLPGHLRSRRTTTPTRAS